MERPRKPMNRPEEVSKSLSLLPFRFFSEPSTLPPVSSDGDAIGPSLGRTTFIDFLLSQPTIDVLNWQMSGDRFMNLWIDDCFDFFVCFCFRGFRGFMSTVVGELSFIIRRIYEIAL